MFASTDANVPLRRQPAKDYTRFMFCSRLLAGSAGIFLLAGCSIDLGSSLGLGGSDKTSAQVVGDEPFAVKVGAATLAQGGDAVDAATAMFFALSVTYPVSAGLGGGGICIVHDPARNQSEEFDFLTHDAAGGGAYAVPGNVRGFALMQNAYGALPWQKLVAPAEVYARTGFPISRALADRLKDAEDVVRLDAGLAAEFMDESGHVKGTGSIAANVDLADTLAIVRTQGADGFYTGPVGAKIVAYSASQGGAIGAAELAAYHANRATPRVLRMGDDYVFLPEPAPERALLPVRCLTILARAQATPAGEQDTEAAVICRHQTDAEGFRPRQSAEGSRRYGVRRHRCQGASGGLRRDDERPLWIGPYGAGHGRDPGAHALVGCRRPGLRVPDAGDRQPQRRPPGDARRSRCGRAEWHAGIAYALTRITHGKEISRAVNCAPREWRRTTP